MYTIYSKQDCPNCKTAKNVLQYKNVPFRDIEVVFSDVDEDSKDSKINISDFLSKYPSVRVMPLIIDDDGKTITLTELIEKMR